jgi:hypothetical protein
MVKPARDDQQVLLTVDVVGYDNSMLGFALLRDVTVV